MMWERQLPEKVYTLVMVRQDGKVLLGMKKRGFGQGKWNGFGGKVEEGETILEAANRELEEECGLQSDDLTHVGILRFEFEDMPSILNVYVFVTKNFTGTVRESNEMAPKWFSEEDIPYNAMWADDRFWLPLLLEGHNFQGYFVYKNEETIVRHEITILQEFFK